MPKCANCEDDVIYSADDHDEHLHLSRVPGGDPEPDVESWTFCSQECFQEWMEDRYE